MATAHRTYHGVRIADLLDAGVLTAGTTLIDAQDSGDITATVLDDRGEWPDR
jgi:hypothetical protein